MNKLHIIVAGVALVAAVAVGHSTAKPSMPAPKAQDTCVSVCPAQDSCDCSPCDCVSCGR